MFKTFRQKHWNNLPESFRTHLEAVLGPKLEILSYLAKKHQIFDDKMFYSNQFRKSKPPVQLAGMALRTAQLGNKLVQTKDVTDAEHAWLISLELQPNENIAVYSLANFYDKRGEFTLAKKHALAAYDNFKAWHAGKVSTQGQEVSAEKLHSLMGNQAFQGLTTALAHIAGNAELWLRLPERMRPIYDLSCESSTID